MWMLMMRDYCNDMIPLRGANCPEWPGCQGRRGYLCYATESLASAALADLAAWERSRPQPSWSGGMLCFQRGDVAPYVLSDGHQVTTAEYGLTA